MAEARAARLLFVDDDAELRTVMRMRLEAAGYEVVDADSAEQALGLIDSARPQLVICDLRMPGMGGIDMLERLQHTRPGLPVIILTGFGDIPDAVRATKSGAVEFMTKPVESKDLLACIERYLGSAGAEPGDAAWEGTVVARSQQMRSLLDDAARIARTDSSVLISGPSGAGKEVVARVIHDASPRSERPFIAINCGAVPAELLESELFGHKKGAFTGAHSDHLGLFRSAAGGTVFLDEIGDMPAELQVKLLRVLQEREVRPVGETRSVPVDVRVLSATHRNLQQLVQSQGFREDLYYRLNVVQLELPPLDARREDIPALVAHQLRKLAERGAPRRVYAPEAMELLVAANWPGNVRQLFNVVEQNVALASSRVISAALVQKAIGGNSSRTMPSFDEARAEFTRNYLCQLLELADGNVSHAARLAERNRTNFYKLLSRHGIDPQNFKSQAA